MQRGFNLGAANDELSIPTLGSKFRDNDSMATNYSSGGEEDEMTSVALHATTEGSDKRADLIQLPSNNGHETTKVDEEIILRGRKHAEPPPLLGGEANSCSGSIAPSSLVSIPFSTNITAQNTANESPTVKIICKQPFFRRTNPNTTNNDHSNKTDPTVDNRPSSVPTIAKQKRDGLLHSLSWDSRLTEAPAYALPFRPRQPLPHLKSPQQPQPTPSLQPPQGRQRPLVQPDLSTKNQQHSMPFNTSPQHRREDSNNSAFFEWNSTLKNKTNNPNNVFFLESPQRVDLADCKNSERSSSHGLHPTPQCQEKGTKLNYISEGEEIALGMLSSFVHQTQFFLHEQEKENTRLGTKNRVRGTDTAELSEIVASLKLASKSFSHENQSSPFTHDDRCQLLDELLLTQRYANEMLIITGSANKWLSSIGWNDASPAGLSMGCDQDGKQQISNEVSTATISSRSKMTTLFPPSEVRNAVAIAGNESPRSPLLGDVESDSAAMLARLSSAKKEIQTKDSLIAQLNEELSKCREEIGRLKVTRSEERPFKSPNRSILDDDDSDNDASVCLNTPSLFLNSLSPANEPLKDEGVAGKVPCELDNNQLCNESVPRDRPTTPIGSMNTVLPSTPSCATKMINVHMLDAENFVTAWDDIGPLPPPPDHSLHAPIVHALLEQWTSDRAMHESLLKWLECILDCSIDICHIPPLTISNLNHQVRDGFIMHVIPNLLRRIDVQVDVKTRAHRKTTYDISVSVGKASQPSHPNSSSQSQLDHESTMLCNATKTSKISMMAFNASSSNFVQEKDEDRLTSIVSNRTSDLALAKQPFTSFHDKNIPSDDKNIPSDYRFWNDDGSVESSVTAATCLRTPPRDTEERSALMKAFGSAFGGLLARRSVGKEYWQHSSNTATRRPVRQSVEDVRQPYHRVVTAPPGRLNASLILA